VQAALQPAVQDVLSASSKRSALLPDPAVIANSVRLAYGPNTVLTTHEIKRQTLVSRWLGTYVVGPPRFDDRASEIHIFSKNGGANQFLRGKLQMVIDPPANPDAVANPGNPFANQVTGTAALFTSNYLQSGGLGILDLYGQPVPGRGGTPLPTHLNWTFDSFSSAGPYTAPSLNFNQGQGVVDIHYIPDPQPVPGTLASGHVVVTFQGVINFSQIIANTGKPYN
jgi:hypothetical protein